MPTPSDPRWPQAALLAAAATIARDRVALRRGRRAAARPDEDAVTLAADAVAALSAPLDDVGAIVLATTTPPYAEGGSVQVLAELLGLDGSVFALELASNRRDGLAAVRVAAGLAQAGTTVLLCAAHAAPRDAATGDGAIALLLGASDGDGDGAIAVLTPVAASTVELRDRWRLPDGPVREADRSFTEAIATSHLGRALRDAVAAGQRAPAAVVGPDPRGSAALERELDGPGDPLSRSCGTLGAAHPLARLVAGLDGGGGLVLALSNGLGEAVHVAPTPAGAPVARALREAAEHGGRPVEAPLADPAAHDFHPFSSGPRSWRDRGADLRLEGLVGPLATSPGRRHPTGTVLAWTRDHVYPAAPTTEMVAVAMDAGGQFFGQVAMGETVAIGDRVELVPRRLHTGGGAVQYFWKAKPCP
jgi:hypothetical protein